MLVGVILDGSSVVIPCPTQHRKHDLCALEFDVGANSNGGRGGSSGVSGPIGECAGDEGIRAERIKTSL